MEQNLYTFIATSCVGLLIIILGFKFSEKTRKVVETTGAILFHVGIFGILYYKVSLNLFISVFTLVISIFILIDPLKISNHLNSKIYRLVGYMLLFSAVAFSLDYFSGFPVWLWAIPLMIYLSPYLFNSLKTRLKSVLAVAWLVVLFYMGLIGYVIYAKYNPDANIPFITQLFPQLHVPEVAEEITLIQKKSSSVLNVPIENSENKKVQETKIIPDSQISPKNLLTNSSTNNIPINNINTEDNLTPETQGPYLKSLQVADDEYLKLQKEYQKLKDENQKLKDENENLKNRLNHI